MLLLKVTAPWLILPNVISHMGVSSSPSRPSNCKDVSWFCSVLFPVIFPEFTSAHLEESYHFGNREFIQIHLCPWVPSQNRQCGSLLWGSHLFLYRTVHKLVLVQQMVSCLLVLQFHRLTDRLWFQNDLMSKLPLRYWVIVARVDLLSMPIKIFLSI